VFRRVSSIISIAFLALVVGCGGGGGGDDPSPTPPPVDTTPDAITFANQSGVARSTAVSSNAITVTGINAAAPVSITGGEYSIGGGAFTNAAGTVSNNQTITVRVNSPAQFSTQASATLTVGGVQVVFTVTTLDEDTTPDAFQFQAIGGAPRAQSFTSNETTISGINSAAPVSITGGEYSIDGGAFTSAAGTINEGQLVRVRVTSAALFSTATSAALNVGGVTGAFTVTTLAADHTPDAFQFQRIADTALDTWVASNTVTITGVNDPAQVTITDGEYSIAGGPYTSTPGLVEDGQTLRVRARSSSIYSATARARVTVGTVTEEFAVTTQATVPDAVVFDDQDVVYLLSIANRLVMRWSLGSERYLDPYTVEVAGAGPTTIAYSSAHGRLYLAYATGAIRYIDVTGSSAAQQTFVSLPTAVGGLASVGNFLLAQDSSGSWETHYIYDSAGVLRDSAEWNHYSPEYAWDPNTSRVYWFSMWSPPDLNYEVINQATGEITSQGETPYHGTYSIQAPIRVHPSGQYVLLGSGDLYDRTALTWAGSLGAAVTDARWSADGSLITLRTTGPMNNQAILTHLDGANLRTLEQVNYAGRAIRVIGSDSRMAVLVTDNSTVRFHIYVPNNDTDADGVANAQDAFPLDAAASVDNDGDGYPDTWNAGRSQADSTTGLALDAYSQDRECWLTAHGSGGACDYGATMPNYVPDEVAHAGDIIYLLSAANRRVYRWSIGAGAYLKPYVVGFREGFRDIAPTLMAHSSAHQRLYLGYETGEIRYIGAGVGNAVETAFTEVPVAVGGLASVGNYLFVQDEGSSWPMHYLFNANGIVTDSEQSYYSSPEYAWDPVNSRLYFSRANVFPGGMSYAVIDPSSGQFTNRVDTGYLDSNPIQVPIRVSANGQRVLVGSGHLYDRVTNTWPGSLGLSIADGRWMANGSLIALTTNNTQSSLSRLSGSLDTLEQVTYTGQALRVVGSDASMVVLLIDNGTVRFQRYTPSDDSDADGVLNTQDAFPSDPAAAADSDRDGSPDAWLAGMSQADSTTGLALDAYALDSGCWLPAHGNGVACNPGSTVPDFVPDEIVQDGDVIYLLSNANRRVYRWSISGGAYLNPYLVGVNQGLSTVAPVSMAWSSAHQRLYLGYATGAIRHIDSGVANPPTSTFSTVPTGVNGLTSADDFLLAHAAMSYVLDSSGAIVGPGGGNPSSRDITWDPVNSRLYYFRDGSSPNDLHYQEIDPTTGEVVSGGETPYHGSYEIEPPIRVSVDGQYVLLGSGDFYEQNDLTWINSLGNRITDARWLANGSLVTLMTSGNQTTVRRLNGVAHALLEERSFPGQALRVVGSDAAMIVIVLDNGRVDFHNYVPSEDSDGDGVQNTLDAFPLDPAASADTDHDGYPDAWNAGRSQSDSTTGLSLDAFPLDSACWLSAHGSGGVCDHDATIPDYYPDQVVNNGDIIYLLSSANRRVYRWSMATGEYLNPYIIGMSQGSDVEVPHKMVYSSAHQRLYLGYQSGTIRYIDVTAGHPTETHFANVSIYMNGLVSVGNFILAQDDSGAWETHYVINSAGVIVDSAEWNYYSHEYGWDPIASRVYFFRSSVSPRDLHYEVIDQTTGEITSAGESPYHGELGWNGVIRPSSDGQRVLLGSGAIFRQNGLTLADSIGPITDAYWTDDYLVDVDSSDLVEIRDAHTLEVLMSYQYLGVPVRVLSGQTESYLVHRMGNTTAFVRLPFFDADGDTIPRWWEQLYGLSDTNAGDALGDLDGDGVNNADEYAGRANPLVADTDADGLSDFQEIVTYGTNPAKPDSDDDGLSDEDEVLTHLTDPWDADSDNDGYTDLDEVLYGGDPNDASGLPPPLTNYSQTFEGSPNLAAWTTPELSVSPWAIDSAVTHGGAASLKAGALADYQQSGVKFRGVFAAGHLRFWARVDSQGCCDRLQVWVDGVQVRSIDPTNQWNQYDVELAAGIREIEWRFQKDHYQIYGGENAWIDDVTFTLQ
jgi:hypothetical protein